MTIIIFALMVMVMAIICKVMVVMSDENDVRIAEFNVVLFIVFGVDVGVVVGVVVGFVFVVVVAVVVVVIY